MSFAGGPPSSLAAKSEWRRRTNVEGEEVPTRTWELFRSEDLLDERTVETMLSGLSTRRYERALEPTGEQGSSTSRSAVSRRFVRRTRERLGELMSRPVPPGEVPFKPHECRGKVAPRRLRSRLLER